MMEPLIRIHVAQTKIKTGRCGRQSFAAGFAIVLVTLLLVTDGITSVRMTDALNTKDAIHIAGFVPRSSPMKIPIPNGEDDGRGVLTAVRLAVYHVNLNEHILPDHVLHIVWNDTECSGSDGLNAFSDMMNYPPLKYMLFGDVCTQVTDQLSKKARQWKVAQLSYTATHPMFTKETHPNLFRIVPSENELNPPRLELLKKHNWTRVATIYQNEQRYSLAHDNLLAELLRMGVEVVTNHSLDYDHVPVILQNLKENDVHIILGNFNETWARSIFCEAYREKLYGSKYQWLIAAPYTRLWWRRDDNNINCAISEVEIALKGALLMDILPLSTSNMSTISGITADEYNEVYQMVNLGVYSHFHAYAYDGVWAIALALHNIHKFYPDPVQTQNKDLLRAFKYHDEKWQTAFLTSFETMAFRGVTGKVEFRDNGRMGTISIKQMRDLNTVMADVKIGEFDSESEIFYFEKEIVWNGDNPSKDRSINVGGQTQSAMTVVSTARMVFAGYILILTISADFLCEWSL